MTELKRNEAINRCIDRLSDLIGEDFHGYRSVVWVALSVLLKENTRQPTDTDVLREAWNLINDMLLDANVFPHLELLERAKKFLYLNSTKTQEEGGDTTVRGHLLRDIKNLPSEDIHVLYRYMRRHMIANIPGLEDPLAYLRGESTRLKDSETQEKGGVCEWTCKDADILLYGGTCGTEWVFDEPPRGDYNYCPNCGKPIRLKDSETQEGGGDD